MLRLDQNDNIVSIKDAVLCEVARLAFEGKLDEDKGMLPYEMIPGPNAFFRCCIYKEREIIRQRIRLAEGKAPREDMFSDNIVQVISSACEECTLGHYQVTDNCRRCVSKKCQSACRFDAITMEAGRAHINMDKCKECGKCAQACPYHAIVDLTRPCKRACPVDAITWHKESGIVKIDDAKCIRCGACIEACPFGAVGSRTFMVDVINKIRAGKKVVAMLAPAGEGQFGKGITMGSLAESVKELGFTDCVAVELGADLTAAYEAEEWAEAYANGQKKVTSCCPAFVNMVKKHFPTLAGNISTTVSPMCATSRMLKAMDPETITVFVGPCIAKKEEILDSELEGNADYVLTYNELRCMLEAKDVVLKPEAANVQQGSIYAKRFANSGGVTAAVVQALKEKGVEADVKVAVCNGAAECKKALMMMRVGKLPEDFIEGMCCVGGCVAGPGSAKCEFDSRKDREALLKMADNREIYANIESVDQDSFSMHRGHHE